MEGNSFKKVGAWSFVIGVIVALLAAFLPATMSGAITAVLVILGLVVGLLNVTEKETTNFIIASVAIMIALFTAGSAIQANIAALSTIGTYLWAVMSNINVFVFPATIVVAIKAIYALAKN
ncbi:MAG: hypothetical protein PHT54_04125 [Candidatus Nanoarchaeia archaeon]|nr:hypothetical protein [Candidatus Nanoarchaeia archaeon]